MVKWLIIIFFIVIGLSFFIQRAVQQTLGEKDAAVKQEETVLPPNNAPVREKINPPATVKASSLTHAQVMLTNRTPPVKEAPLHNNNILIQ